VWVVSTGASAISSIEVESHRAGSEIHVAALEGYIDIASQFYSARSMDPSNRPLTVQFNFDEVLFFMFLPTRAPRVSLVTRATQQRWREDNCFHVSVEYRYFRQ